MKETMYRNRVLTALRGSAIPSAIETVRKEAGIKSWVTAKATLLELLVEELILGQKTTKSWIFWLENGTNTNPKLGQSIEKKS